MKRLTRRKSATRARATVLEQQMLLSAWRQTLAEITPGLTHDFNNVLTGILGLTEACLLQMEASHPFRESLALIQRQAREASQLIHRIAGLYEDQPAERNYHDLNSIAAEVVEVLRKVISRRIEIKSQLIRKSLPVYVNAVEFRRVLLGLAVGAVRNIPERGKLHFQTSQPRPLISKRYRGEFPGPGAFCWSMESSGNGLVQATFENPLASGKLDLSTLSLHQANVFIENNRGALSIESKPGTAALRLWLPEADFTEAQANKRMSAAR